MNNAISLPDDLFLRVSEMAQRERMSLEDFVSAALSEQLAAHDYVARRAARATDSTFRAALERIPDIEPEENDRL